MCVCVSHASTDCSPIVQSYGKLQMSHVKLDGLVIVLYEGVGVPEAVARLGFHGDVTDLSRHLQCVSACVGEKEKQEESILLIAQ